MSVTSVIVSAAITSQVSF